MMQYIRVPDERIGVLIGEKGEVKSEIQRLTGIRVDVDSSSGDITVDDRDCSDPLAPIKVASLVRAIGRGFSPQKAFRLLRDEFYFETMDIRDYVGKKQEHVRRMRGRIIGTNGKTRRIIEELSGTDISIHGNTVSIIGEIVELGIARAAVDMLLSGSEHSTVYRFLERKKKELRIAELGLEIIHENEDAEDEDAERESPVTENADDTAGDRDEKAKSGPGTDAEDFDEKEADNSDERDS
jgi:ribosomal RNA assembly protein